MIIKREGPDKKRKAFWRHEGLTPGWWWPGARNASAQQNQLIGRYSFSRLPLQQRWCQTVTDENDAQPLWMSDAYHHRESEKYCLKRGFVAIVLTLVCRRYFLGDWDAWMPRGSRRRFFMLLNKPYKWPSADWGKINMKSPPTIHFTRESAISQTPY